MVGTWHFHHCGQGSIPDLVNEIPPQAVLRPNKEGRGGRRRRGEWGRRGRKGGEEGEGKDGEEGGESYERN